MQDPEFLEEVYKCSATRWMRKESKAIGILMKFAFNQNPDRLLIERLSSFCGIRIL